MTNASRERGFITADIAAALLRISRRRFFQLVEQKWIAKAERGKYRLRDVVQGFIALRDDQIERIERRNADNRIRDARAREIELRTAREEASLVPSDEVIAWTDSVLDELMRHLRELPARVSDDAREQVRISDMIEFIGRKAYEAGAEYRKAWGRE